MTTETTAVVASLIKRGIFESEEQAVRELLRGYVLAQIGTLRQTLAGFEQRYGMTFERFAEYLRERSSLLGSETLTSEQRAVLGRAVMQEEDDWLEWKAANELLESWLGLRAEVAAS